MKTLVPFLSVLFVASGALAQDSDDLIQISAGFQLGVGGSVGESPAEVDLDPSFGFQLQAHYPFGDYLLLGGSLAYRSHQLKDFDKRDGVFAIGASVGGHYMIDVASLRIDPFVVATVGLGVTSPGQEGADTATGVDFGIRAGSNVWFTELIGAYLSLGYQLTTASTEPESTTYGQFAIDLGVAIRL